MPVHLLLLGLDFYMLLTIEAYHLVYGYVLQISRSEIILSLFCSGFVMIIYETCYELNISIIFILKGKNLLLLLFQQQVFAFENEDDTNIQFIGSFINKAKTLLLVYYKKKYIYIHDLEKLHIPSAIRLMFNISYFFFLTSFAEFSATRLAL